MFRNVDLFENPPNIRRYGFSNSLYSFKVLLVDHNEDFLAYAVDLLRSCSFEVAYADHSIEAINALSEKRNGFNLVMIADDMKDLDVHTFLKITRNMNVLSIVMSDQDDAVFLYETFKNGAFHVLKRPITTNTIRIIRQGIVREMMENNFLKNLNSKTSGSKRKNRSYDDNAYEGSSYDDDAMKKKTCVQWTNELHMKFLIAIRQIDGARERCVPKRILDLMDVPALTRMQVASHLQKWRKENMNSNLGVHNDEAESSTHVGFNLSINGWQLEQMWNQTYPSSSLVNISNLNNNVEPIEYTPIPFGFGSNQNEGFGNKIARTTNNYIHQETSGVLDVGQGSNYHDFSSIQGLESNEFLNYLNDLDGDGPNDI